MRARLPWAMLCGLSACLQFGVICAGQIPSNSQPPEASAAVTKIAGTAVSSVTGAPLAQTRVSIADTRNRANMLWMVTNESGRFEFDRIPPGKYSLVGAKRGFLNGAYEQHEQFSTAIVTGTEFDTTQLVLRLTPMASIEGKVVDEAGDPVRQGQVTLYRENQEMGFGRIAPVNRGVNERSGHVRIRTAASWEILRGGFRTALVRGASRQPFRGSKRERDAADRSISGCGLPDNVQRWSDRGRWRCAYRSEGWGSQRDRDTHFSCSIAANSVPCSGGRRRTRIRTAESLRNEFSTSPSITSLAKFAASGMAYVK